MTKLGYWAHHTFHQVKNHAGKIPLSINSWFEILGHGQVSESNRFELRITLTTIQNLWLYFANLIEI
jgi:hypothetical protein